MPDIIVTSEQDDLAVKLPIEAALTVAFGKLFDKVAADFMTVYSAVGEIIDAEVYRSETIGLLEPAYRSAGDTAGRELRTNVEVSFPADNEEEANAAVDANLSGFAERESEERAKIIEETTNRQLDDFTLEAIATAAALGIVPSNEEIAEIAAERFAGRTPSRSRFIGIQEALNAVEGSRLVEAETLGERGAYVSLEGAEAVSLSASLFREWIARIDDWANVRPTHKIAHGQRVFGAREPFRVGNDYLMYPGDTSLGASMEEIAGCR
ncbi:MAG: hypothetical protein PVJ86_11685, partial [Phycisphaerales bacterium]